MHEKEKIVVKWLKSNGYRKVVVKNENHWIEADSSMRRMAVKIEQSELKDFESELKDFESEAKDVLREAWIATVDPADNFVGWKRIV